MPKIGLAARIIFGSLATLLVFLTLLCLKSVSHWLLPYDFFLQTVAFMVIFLTLSLLTYRLIGAVFPFSEGLFVPRSWPETVHNVRTLLWLFFFNPLVCSHLIPPPLTALAYRLFGAHIGENSYPSGAMLFDPDALYIGDNVVFGMNMVITPHIIEHDTLGIIPIHIGNNVTLGVGSIILAGTHIGEGAVIAAGAVLPKHTQVGAYEIYAGVPAKKIGMVAVPTPTLTK